MALYLKASIKLLLSLLVLQVQAHAVLRAASCNTPDNRACWTADFDVNTDFETSTPVTGLTRTYTFYINEVDNFIGADGQVKTKAMLVNNQFPGPTVIADWGDRINITVVNNLAANGTSIHWHGLRQFNNNIMDGTNGITECPIPPGGSKTYSFLATQYGTSWYHSHFSSQYANGVAGPIVIHGPTSLNYDIDLGVFPISDWYYDSADHLLARVMDPGNPFIPNFPGSPPPSDNVFFNGTNINPNGTGGAYAKVILTPGKRHLLRLLNPSVDNTFTVSIVGHSMTIVATDFVPIAAYTTSSIYMGVGQRYDVTIDASEPVGSYWINITYSSTGVCGSSKNQFAAAIIQYSGAPDALPTESGTAPLEAYCVDSVDFKPIVARLSPQANFTATPSNTLTAALVADAAASKVYWTVNSSSMNVLWERPTLEYILNQNSTDSTMPKSENIIRVPDSNQWAFWVIQNNSPIPHPTHLHGHDFLILGRSSAPTDPLAAGSTPVLFNPNTDTPSLTFSNPTRRDTTMLPAWGWLVVGFRTDNPGSWLFHCHIAWHASQGLSVQFLERAGDIPAVMDLSQVEQNCNAWRTYAPSDPFKKTDSGL